MSDAAPSLARWPRLLIAAILLIGLLAPAVWYACAGGGSLRERTLGLPPFSPQVILRGSPEVDAAIPGFRVVPVYEQWAEVVAFFGVKFLYTLGAAILIGLLWRRGESDLAALRRALICFFLGENCCFINVMFFFDSSPLFEHIHSLGMVLTFGFSAYALIEGLDTRLIHFSGPGRCAAGGLCRGCIKQAAVPCGFRRLFLATIPATAVVASMPLFSAFRETIYHTRIFGILHTYTHPLMHQVYEIRYLPVAAIVLLTLAFGVLWLIERHPAPLSKILFSAAIGAMGFSFFRWILVGCYEDRQVWFDAWEETTELLYVLLVAGVLFAFHRGLLPTPEDAP